MYAVCALSVLWLQGIKLMKDWLNLHLLNNMLSTGDSRWGTWILTPRLDTDSFVKGGFTVWGQCTEENLVAKDFLKDIQLV